VAAGKDGESMAVGVLDVDDVDDDLRVAFDGLKDGDSTIILGICIMPEARSWGGAEAREAAELRKSSSVGGDDTVVGVGTRAGVASFGEERSFAESGVERAPGDDELDRGTP